MTLLNKTITWGDASEETVVIADDYKVTLAGTQKNLFGMVLVPVNPLCSTYAQRWDFYREENLLFFGKMLDYLQTKGVRVIRVAMNHTLSAVENDAAYYGAFFDLFWDRKFLLIPYITVKYMTGANAAIKAGTMSAFPIEYSEDTLDEWLDRLLPIMATYDNIITVQCENEFDYPTEGDQDYTAANVTTYMQYLVGRVNTSLPGIPTTHNIMDDNTLTEIKAAALAEVDIPSIDTYRESGSAMSTALATMKTNRGLTNYWVLECGNYDNPTFNHDLVDASYPNACFKSGATLSLMFGMTHETDTTQQYFDWYGAPKANLAECLRHFNSLQNIGRVV